MLYYSLRNGDAMPLLGLGTYGLNGAEGTRAVSEALEIGYRHVDTAANYGNEEVVGAALKESGLPRSELFVTTKVDRADLGRQDFRASCLRSLERLELEYVDLLLAHWPNRDIPIRETVEAAAELLEEGRIRHFGVSNFIRPRLLESIEASPVPVETNQVEYHPWLQQKGLLRLCREREVLLTAYSPLGKGEVLEDSVLREIAERMGRTVAQVALRWLLENGIAAIPRSGSARRLRENFGALEFSLSEEDRTRIDNISTRRRVIDWWPGDFDSDPGAYDG